MQLKVYTDGASRGNPGPAAIGIVIKDDQDREVAAISQPIGVTTNNKAEYQAVITALEVAATLEPARIALYLDSELVVRQINGEYEVRNASLLPLFQRAIALTKAAGNVTIAYIPREQNREAHALAERALKPSWPKATTKP